MDFQWDENKRQIVIHTHGVDIIYAALIFENRTITYVDDRQEYGEVRLKSVGMVGDECFVVVHTERNGKIRLITAWRGGRNEREKYQNGIP